jgi:hypothetical protein
VIGWLALGLLIGLFVGLAIGARRSWVRQRDADVEAAWREVAIRIGHAYSTADAPHELDRLPLPLLGRIDTEVVAPELTGPSEGGIQRLFIASIDGRPATIGVADLAHPVPDCSLQPTGVVGPEVGVGWGPVDPGLSHVRSRFDVRGADAEAIEAFLAGELGGWMAGEGTEWSVELAGNQVLVGRSEMPIERLGEVAEALDAFRARLPWATSPSTPNGEGAGDRNGESGGTRRKRRRRRRKRGGGDGGDSGGTSESGGGTDRGSGD